MPIARVILITSLAALLLGIGASYLAAYSQAQDSLNMYKSQIKENTERKRVKICQETGDLFPNNTALAIEKIKNEIDATRNRKTIRWQE